MAGQSDKSIFVAPTGQDPPYSRKVAYCEAWKVKEIVLRGWLSKQQTVLIQENDQGHSPQLHFTSDID